MASEYFDDMHKKLGANKLDPKEQKKLLEKFKKHGGQFVKPPGKEGATENNAGETSKYDSKSQAKQEALVLEKEIEELRVKEDKLKKRKSSFFDWLSLRLNAYVLGITNITGSKYKRKFINSISTNLENNLANLVKIISLAIDSSTKEGHKTIDIMRQNSAHDYELLKLAKQIYNPKDFSDIRNIAKTNTEDIDISLIFKCITAIYKKVYLFRKQQAKIAKGLNIAFKIHKAENKGVDLDTTFAQIKTIISNVFNKFLFNLHYSYCVYLNKNILIDDYSQLNKYLQIKEQETVDSIITQTILDKENIKLEKEEDQEEDTKEDSDDKKHFKDIPKELQDGHKWIESLDYTNPSSMNQKKPEHYLDTNDKIFKLYVILEEFEKEFSFILTSNKIKFNVDWSEGKRWDPKKEFNDTYIELNRIHESIKAYASLVKTITQFENEPSAKQHNIRERKSKLDTEKMNLNSNIKKSVLDVATKISNTTQGIIADNDSIQDKNLRLLFDNIIDGNKKLARKTPLEAIKLCNNYLEYLIYIITQGELHGSAPSF